MGLLFGWLYYAVVQLVNLICIILGTVLLAPMCMFHLWNVDKISIKPLDPQQIEAMNLGGTVVPLQNGQREISSWKLSLLNLVYGNPEDGVSGQEALLWNGDKLVQYMPSSFTGIKKWFYDAWRAYDWSVIRNSADNLKYIFQWRGNNAPYASGQIKLFGKTFNYAFGWKVENFKYQVPIFGFKPAR